MDRTKEMNWLLSICIIFCDYIPAAMLNISINDVAFFHLTLLISHSKINFITNYSFLHFQWPSASVLRDFGKLIYSRQTAKSQEWFTFGVKILLFAILKTVRRKVCFGAQVKLVNDRQDQLNSIKIAWPNKIGASKYWRIECINLTHFHHFSDGFHRINAVQSNFVFENMHNLHS